MIFHLFIVGTNQFTLMPNSDFGAAEELLGKKSLNLMTMKINALAQHNGLTILVYGADGRGAWKQVHRIGIKKGDIITPPHRRT